MHVVGWEHATLYINLPSKLGKYIIVIACKRMSTRGLSALLFKLNLGKSLYIEEPAKREIRWLAYRCISMFTGVCIYPFLVQVLFMFYRDSSPCNKYRVSSLFMLFYFILLLLVYYLSSLLSFSFLSLLLLWSYYFKLCYLFLNFHLSPIIQIQNKSILSVWPIFIQSAA